MMQVMSNKGPRFRKEKYIHNILDTSYNRFKNDYPEFDTSEEEFLRIWNKVLAPEIRKEIGNNPLGIKLPYYLGEVKAQWLPYILKKDKMVTKEGNTSFDKLDLTNGGKTMVVKWERRTAVRYTRMLQFYAFEADRKIKDIAKKREKETPEDIRVSRVTLGGNKYGLSSKK
jgi:hypothetical protein